MSHREGGSNGEKEQERARERVRESQRGTINYAYFLAHVFSQKKPKDI
jgi:hypothetical protein